MATRVFRVQDYITCKKIFFFLSNLASIYFSSLVCVWVCVCVYFITMLNSGVLLILLIFSREILSLFLRYCDDSCRSFCGLYVMEHLHIDCEFLFSEEC